MAHTYKIEIEQKDEPKYDERRTFELQVPLTDEQFAVLISDIVSTATEPDFIESGTKQTEA